MKEKKTPIDLFGSKTTNLWFMRDYTLLIQNCGNAQQLGQEVITNTTAPSI